MCHNKQSTTGQQRPFLLASTKVQHLAIFVRVLSEQYEQGSRSSAHKKGRCSNGSGMLGCDVEVARF